MSDSTYKYAKYKSKYLSEVNQQVGGAILLRKSIPPMMLANKVSKFIMSYYSPELRNEFMKNLQNNMAFIASEEQKKSKIDEYLNLIKQKNYSFLDSLKHHKDKEMIEHLTFQAGQLSDLDFIKMVVDRKMISVNRALYMTVHSNNYKIVEYLINKGVSDLNTPFRLAAINGYDEKIIRLLVDTAIEWATDRKTKELIKSLKP